MGCVMSQEGRDGTSGLLSPLALRAHSLRSACRPGLSPGSSNPGWGSLPITIFETVPFNRSGTPPHQDTVC